MEIGGSHGLHRDRHRQEEPCRQRRRGDGRTVAVSFKLNDTASCFAKMLKRLRKAGTTPENGLVGMEATGHYWVALFDLLTSHGYEATVINSIQTDAFRGVWTVRKVKTDALDAAMIADEGQVARRPSPA